MRPSSTSVFKQRPTLKRILLTLALSFVVLLVADQLIGLIIDHSTDQAPLILQHNGAGIVHLWTLTDAGITPIAFLGSSQMQAAASPSQFDSDIKMATGQQVSSVNLGITGATTLITRNVLFNFAMPNSIHTVFVGLELRALREGPDQDDALQKFHDSPIGFALLRQSPLERWTLLSLIKYSAIVRYQGNLQYWLRGNAIPLDPSAQTDTDGHLVLTGIHSRNPEVIKDEFVSFHSDAHLQAALDDIGAVCMQAKLDCIFVNMPLHVAAYQYITAQDSQTYLALISGIAKAHHIPIWDFDTDACHAVFSDSNFYDLNHLNEKGAKLFTDHLARVYIQQRIDPSQPLGDNCAQITQ